MRAIDLGGGFQMAMQIPESWRESAMLAFERDRRGTEGVISEDMAENILTHFRDQEFRQRFFEIIGHKYVLAIQQILTVDPDTKRFTQAQWRTKLGVDAVTIWRWKKDLNMAGGEKFFVAQMLLSDLSIPNLTLPDNNIMLGRSIICACKYLKYRYDPLNESGPITIELFRVIQQLMHVMTFSKEALYNPFSKKQSTKSKEAALKMLANHLAKRGDSTKQPKVLPSAIKSWLDGWGMAFAMFVIGNRLSWKQLSS
jgi:hypothetical protein